ncbi:MAG: hypothetical protein H8D97_01710 [Proteobacteria bacterium]|nr:hypothetical protein [Pseudomonadota bacterium]
MHRTLINQAIREANKVDFKYRLGAIIFKNKTRIISTGHNHGNRFRRNLKPKYTRWIGSLHAEVDAILNTKENLHNMQMLVIRIDKSGGFRLAKPCEEHCMKYIENVGLKRVYYSIDNDNFGIIERRNFGNSDKIIEI